MFVCMYVCMYICMKLVEIGWNFEILELGDRVFSFGIFGFFAFLEVWEFLQLGYGVFRFGILVFLNLGIFWNWEMVCLVLDFLQL